MASISASVELQIHLKLLCLSSYCYLLTSPPPPPIKEDLLGWGNSKFWLQLNLQGHAPNITQLFSRPPKRQILIVPWITVCTSINHKYSTFLCFKKNGGFWSFEIMLGHVLMLLRGAGKTGETNFARYKQVEMLQTVTSGISTGSSSSSVWSMYIKIFRQHTHTACRQSGKTAHAHTHWWGALHLIIMMLLGLACRWFLVEAGMWRL